jgi:hypothetical protein
MQAGPPADDELDAAKRNALAAIRALVVADPDAGLLPFWDPANLGAFLLAPLQDLLIEGRAAHNERNGLLSMLAANTDAREGVLQSIALPEVARLREVSVAFRDVCTDSMAVRPGVLASDVAAGVHAAVLHRLVDTAPEDATIRLARGQYNLGDQSNPKHVHQVRPAPSGFAEYRGPTSYEDYSPYNVDEILNWSPQWRPMHGPLHLRTRGLSLIFEPALTVAELQERAIFVGLDLNKEQSDDDDDVPTSPFDLINILVDDFKRGQLTPYRRCDSGNKKKKKELDKKVKQFRASLHEARLVLSVDPNLGSYDGYGYGSPLDPATGLNIQADVIALHVHAADVRLVSPKIEGRGEAAGDCVFAGVVVRANGSVSIDGGTFAGVVFADSQDEQPEEASSNLSSCKLTGEMTQGNEECTAAVIVGKGRICAVSDCAFVGAGVTAARGGKVVMDGCSIPGWRDHGCYAAVLALQGGQVQLVGKRTTLGVGSAVREKNGWQPGWGEDLDSDSFIYRERPAENSLLGTQIERPAIMAEEKSAKARRAKKGNTRA